MIVGFVFFYVYGVIDDIEVIVVLVVVNNLFCYVDVCVGGMFFFFVKMLDYLIFVFDFSVLGVIFIFCDLYKFGYVFKGCFFVIYRNKEFW